MLFSLVNCLIYQENLVIIRGAHYMITCRWSAQADTLFLCVCVLLVVERIDSCASMYSRSIQGHHVCLLVKTVSEPHLCSASPVISCFCVAFYVNVFRSTLISPSLDKPYAWTLNVMSRRCSGMCWMRSSRPSLNADCVWQPQDSPHHSCHPQLPPPSTLNQNMITLQNTLTVIWGLPHLLVLRSARFFLTIYFSILHCCVLCTLSSVGHSPTLVVFQSHCVHNLSFLQRTFIFTSWFSAA